MSTSNNFQTPVSNKQKFSIINNKNTSDKCIGTTNNIKLNKSLVKNGVLNKTDKLISDYFTIKSFNSKNNKAHRLNVVNLSPNINSYKNNYEDNISTENNNKDDDIELLKNKNNNNKFCFKQYMVKPNIANKLRSININKTLRNISSRNKGINNEKDLFKAVFGNINDSQANSYEIKNTTCISINKYHQNSIMCSTISKMKNIENGSKKYANLGDSNNNLSINKSNSNFIEKGHSINANIIPNDATKNLKKNINLRKIIINCDNKANQLDNNYFTTSKYINGIFKVNKDINSNSLVENREKIYPLHILKNSELRDAFSNLNSTQVDYINNHKYLKSQYGKESILLYEYIRKYHMTYNTYPNTNLEFYKIGKLLGRGTFGKVNLGLHIATGRLVAIKSFNKMKDKLRILHEVRIMKKIGYHKNIISLYESFESNNYYFIVLEYISGGDLLTYVKRKGKLTESTARFILRQILDGLIYLHSKDIIHRDIKLENILLNTSNQVKICDFGVSREVVKGEFLKNKCGTMAYIAPEVISENGYYGPSADIWSLGVLLYIMLSGYFPFKAINNEHLKEHIMRGKYKTIVDISSEAWNLVTEMMELDVSKRIKIEDIYNHKWMKLEENKKISLFTSSEIYNISMSDIDYRKAEEHEIIENFTLKNLYSIDGDVQKNSKTRSIILAPYNSSEEEYNFDEIEIKKENEILDYNFNAYEESKSYEKRRMEENNIIKNNYSIDNSLNEGNLKNANKKLLINLNNTYTLDYIISQITEFGYKKDYIQKCLKKRMYNYATTSYFILKNILTE